MNPDPRERLPREIFEELMEEGAEAFRNVLEKLLNLAMELERSEFLGAEPYERTSRRRDHANGFKDKTVATRVGRLKLKIPQVRHLSFYPKSLERGCRSEKALKLAIAEMYVKGVSTRKVSQITEQLCGTEISASQVSRIAQLLDEELEQFRERELGEYRVVYLDAHYEKVRVNGTVQDLAILKAIGVNCWGKREVLGVSVALSEAEVHWREFLQALQRRGLKGVDLVVSDDHVGLRAARRAVFPSIPWQRCQFHLAQNAQAHAHNRAQAREMGQGHSGHLQLPLLGRCRGHGGPGSPAVRNGEPPLGKVAGGQHRGRLYGLSFCPISPSQDPHRQPTGTGEQGGPAPHPGGRDLPQRSLGLEIDLGRVGGDSRGVVNRPAVSEPGRLEYDGETWFPDQLQKIGCVISLRYTLHHSPAWLLPRLRQIPANRGRRAVRACTLYQYSHATSRNVR